MVQEQRFREILKTVNFPGLRLKSPKNLAIGRLQPQAR